MDNVFDQYMDLIGGVVNFNSIIMIIIVFGIVMIGISLVKYKIDSVVIKRSVKQAIRELNAEEEIKMLQREMPKDENKTSDIIEQNKDI